MLTSVWSLVSWGRRTAMMILAVGSGRWHGAVRVPGAQAEQSRSRRVGPAAETATPTEASSGAPSPDRLLQQQHPAPPRRPASASVTPAEVRAWARAQGLPVADRGRIPGWVMDQYLAQGGRSAPAQPKAAGTAPARRMPPSTSSAA